MNIYALMSSCSVSIVSRKCQSFRSASLSSSGSSGHLKKEGKGGGGRGVGGRGGDGEARGDGGWEGEEVGRA